MFARAITPTLQERMQQFPVIVLTGPRQSGKTTLLETHYTDYDYLNLESPETYARMQLDPKGILAQKRSHGLIIDEAQKFPELFSYIQVISDQEKKKGQFILSGSQNFLLTEHITQSLAGRAAILELLPLTYSEYLSHSDFPQLSVWQWLYGGGYPRPYQDTIPTKVWVDSYIQTYIERDVRSLLNIRDLITFQTFLRLCAGRHGQLLNITELATDCGISVQTAHQWISILEASYLIFRLPPYYKNFNKRLIKTPKLYFYDTSIVCYLLGIESADHLSIHAARGAIFEGYVISEIKKYFLNKGESKLLYFWRDSNGIEIDCLVEHQGLLQAIEIKSSSTFRPEFIKILNSWAHHITPPCQKNLVYTGEAIPTLQGSHIITWNHIESIFEKSSIAS